MTRDYNRLLEMARQTHDATVITIDTAQMISDVFGDSEFLEGTRRKVGRIMDSFSRDMLGVIDELEGYILESASRKGAE